MAHVGAGELRVPFEVAEKSLAHVLPGIAATYAHADRIDWWLIAGGTAQVNCALREVRSCSSPGMVCHVARSDLVRRRWEQQTAVMTNTGSQVWFITGSSRGLGRALVDAALSAGHRVVATARRRSDLDDVAKRYGERVRAAALDVTDPEQAVRAVQGAVETFGRIDVVVNNAGYANTDSDCGSARSLCCRSWACLHSASCRRASHLARLLDAGTGRKVAATAPAAGCSSNFRDSWAI